jgi:hypothetical protein
VFFGARRARPRVAEAVGGLPLFGGLDAERVTRLAGVGGVTAFEAGQVVFREGHLHDPGRSVRFMNSTTSR